MSDLVIDARVSKAFGDCISLADATLRVQRGTIHAVVGENGAGKSTLLRVVFGLVRADSGQLRINGREVSLSRHHSGDARGDGIGMVQQHGVAAPTLTVLENAVLGREPTRHGMLDLGDAAKAFAAVGARVGLEVDPHAPVESLSVASRQRAEIVAAIWQGARVLILDEPTAVLAPSEVDGLLATLRRLRDDGLTIVVVTHKLDEVRAVADATTVLRAGRTVATFARDVTADQLARAIVGDERIDLIARATAGAHAPRSELTLQLDSVSLRTQATPVSLAVAAGELVGVAGVDGNGQTELAELITGLARTSNGRVRLGAVDITHASVRERQRRGLGSIAEDRHHRGLVLDASVADNLILARADLQRRYWRTGAARKRFVDEQIAALDIRPVDASMQARSLSGGNQQKIVIARELSRPDLKAIVASQPTRGVDLGATATIHSRLRAAAQAGVGVLVISTDLDELLALCHRIVVLHRGALVGELAGEQLVGDAVRLKLSAWMTGLGEVAA